MSAVVQLSPRRLANSVDRLGALNAQISALNKQADAIKAEIKSAGDGVIEGRSYRATVSTTLVVRLDPAKARAVLPANLLAAIESVGEVTRLNLSDL